MQDECQWELQSAVKPSLDIEIEQNDGWQRSAGFLTATGGNTTMG
jgi:hypothetical protein